LNTLALLLFVAFSNSHFTPSPIMSPDATLSSQERQSALPGHLFLNPLSPTRSNAGTDNSRVTAAQKADTHYVPKEQYDTFPYQAVGKVQFGDDATYLCSGAAVGGNVVLTAGHCGAGNDYVKRFFFDPGYYFNYDWSKEFKGYQMFATDNWRFKRRWNEDFAFVVMYKKANKTLEEHLGGALKLGNCFRENAPIKIIGYPVSGTCVNETKKCNGDQMAETTGTLDYHLGPFWGSQTSMGQGASGGPWVTRNTSVCGVTSHGNENPIYRLISGTITQEIMAMYEKARQVDPPNWPPPKTPTPTPQSP